MINEFEIILQEGEGYKVEFKESPDKSLVEEVCAFANASGGRIFIGVSDDGKITGADTSNIARSRLQDTIRQIQPELTVKLEVLSDVIVLTVPEGKEKPYSCSKGFFCGLALMRRSLIGMKLSLSSSRKGVFGLMN